jgi:hypothetical protein
MRSVLLCVCKYIIQTMALGIYYARISKGLNAPMAFHQFAEVALTSGSQLWDSCWLVCGEKLGIHLQELTRRRQRISPLIPETGRNIHPFCAPAWGHLVAMQEPSMATEDTTLLEVCFEGPLSRGGLPGPYGRRECIPQPSGVQKGNPLGPPLFAVTLQGPLEAGKEMQNAGPLMYADGTVLQGTPDPTMQAYAAPIGLHAHPAKSAVYSAATATAISAADLLGLRLAPDGFLVAGTPVCFPAFQAAVESSRCQRRPHLPAVGQAAGPRGAPAGRLSLPASAHGSLVLSCTVATFGRATYVTDAASTHIAMRRELRGFWQFEGPNGTGDKLGTQWEVLYNCAGALWLPELQLSPTSLGTITGAQREFEQHSAEARADVLLASFNPGTETGKCASAQLISSLQDLSSS